ncbi:hypothetical protein AVEN_121056-1, partial [Araneus ventricosus]
MSLCSHMTLVKKKFVPSILLRNLVVKRNESHRNVKKSRIIFGRNFSRSFGNVKEYQRPFQELKSEKVE